MVGQELTQHLQHIEEQLDKLMKSYQDYRSKTNQKEQHNIPLSHHLLYVASLICIIIVATYTISSFIVEVRQYIVYIAIIQTFLSIGLYIFFVKQMTKDARKGQKPQAKVHSTMSIYELDQLRFEILQTLATSSIPQNYITPTMIKKMHQLVKSGMCLTIDECIARFNQESNKKKHEEELAFIQYLRTISYH